MSVLGRRIKLLREGRCLTQEQLGKLIGVSKTAICYYEKDIRIPPLEILVSLSNIFEVSLDYLIGNDALVIDDCYQYVFKMSVDEIRIMQELRKESNKSLYDLLVIDPERTIRLLNNKLR